MPCWKSPSLFRHCSYKKNLSYKIYVLYLSILITTPFNFSVLLYSFKGWWDRGCPRPARSGFTKCYTYAFVLFSVTILSPLGLQCKYLRCGNNIVSVRGNTEWVISWWCVIGQTLIAAVILSIGGRSYSDEHCFLSILSCLSLRLLYDAPHFIRHLWLFSSYCMFARKAKSLSKTAGLKMKYRMAAGYVFLCWEALPW